MLPLPLREVLGARDFRRLFAVRLTGQFCDGLFQAALATFVLFSPERQAGAAEIAAAFAVLYLPYSLIGPFVGVLLDRWRRRQVLLIGNLIRSVIVLGILALTAAGHSGIDLGLAVLAALGVNRFILAGLSAALPHTVPERDLVTANALAPTTGTIMAAAGGIGGVALRAALGGNDRGSLVLLALATIGFVSAGLLARRMTVDLLGPNGPRASDTMVGIARELAAGSRDLWHHRPAWRAVTAVTLHRIVFGALTVIVILLLRNTINPTAAANDALTGLTVILAGAAGGALVGAALTPPAGRLWGTGRWSIAALLLAAVVVPPTVGSELVPWMIVGGAFLGFAGQVLKVCADTKVQRLIADNHLGRVFSLYDMAVNVGLVTGVTAAALTVPTSGRSPATLAVAGAVLLLTAGWLWLHRGSHAGGDSVPDRVAHHSLNSAAAASGSTGPRSSLRSSRNR